VIGNESVFSASVRFLQRRRETGIQWLLRCDHVPRRAFFDSHSRLVLDSPEIPLLRFLE